MKNILVFIIVCILSSCALHFRKNEKLEIVKSNACENKKIVVNMTGLFSNGVRKIPTPFMLNMFKGVIEDRLDKVGLYSIFHVEGYDPEHPYSRNEKTIPNDNKQYDFMIDYYIDLETDETLTNWKSWVGGFSLTIIPMKFNQVLKSEISIKNYQKKELLSTTYSDDYYSWYQILFIPLVWTDTRSQIHRDIIADHATRMLEDLEKICKISIGNK